MTLEVAEALLSHAVLPREEIPSIAVELLEAGTDTPSIRRLAGLTDAELSDAHDLFRQVLRELRRSPPTAEEAATTIARHLASLLLVQGANLRNVAADGARLASAFNYHDALMPFYGADEQYDLPQFWKKSDVDRELIDYARRVQREDPRHDV
jgi:hypothetical protein